MGKYFFDTKTPEEIVRVDSKAKVTGAAKYSAEYNIPGLTYGVLVASTIAKGKILSMDTRAAEKAPGVLAVISHLNSPKVPGYDEGENPAKGPTEGKGFRVFNKNTILFNGQPIALVIADTFERAVHASSLVKTTYHTETHETNLQDAQKKEQPLEGKDFKDYVRGEADAFKNGEVVIQEEYVLPIEVHNPMELHSIITVWHGDNKVIVYDKTQGVKSTQSSICEAFKLPEENVQVISKFVGGGFGSALRTWPHEIAALIGAKKTGKPLKLVLTREQMFTMVGYRPKAIQKVGLGATKDGKLTGITHEAMSHTSSYEEFSEGIVGISRALYACPNVTTRYKVYPLDLSTPTWMRGPGEATGSYALESAIDELSYALNLDPIELRIRNYAEKDPESNLPFSSKYLKEAYQLGADEIGWNNRNSKPGLTKEGGLLVGYGVATGTFGAYRDEAKVLARLFANGTLLVQSAVSDSGPGTSTSMTRVAADAMGIPPQKITFELGDSSLPPGPTQGGSSTTATLGSGVYDVCTALKQKLFDLVKESSTFHDSSNPVRKLEDVIFDKEHILLAADQTKKLSYADALKQAGLHQLEATKASKGGEELSKYASYSYSVHFVKVLVNPLTGMVKVSKVVSALDAGKIISIKTAKSQVVGGVVGGIGMALMEEGVIDDRYGRWINKSIADYHVPVHADVPHIDALFVNKADTIINPIGAKGMGEISLIGVVAAVANAVYNATGKRIRELPITPDKLLI